MLLFVPSTWHSFLAMMSPPYLHGSLQCRIVRDPICAHRHGLHAPLPQQFVNLHLGAWHQHQPHAQSVNQRHVLRIDMWGEKRGTDGD